MKYDKQYAHRGKRQPWDHIYPSKAALSLCGDGPIIPVRIREAEKHEQKKAYWGWHGTNEKHYSLIFSSEMLLDICFPGRKEDNVAKGQGRVVRLIIEEDTGP